MFRLRNRLLLIFVGLAVCPLIIVTAILGQYTYDALQSEALDSQSRTAELVGTKIETFVQFRESELHLLVNNIYGLATPDAVNQNALMWTLISQDNVYQQLALLDENGQEQVRVSRSKVVSEADLINRAQDEAFLTPFTTQAAYYGPVSYDEATYEPLMTIAMPIIDRRSGMVTAVIIADFRFKAVWDLIAGLTLRQGEDIYLLDSLGRVVAHQNPSVVLRGTYLPTPIAHGQVRGVSGTEVIRATYELQWGDQFFTVVVERPISQAFELALNLVTMTLVITVIALLSAVVLVTVSVYQIVRPIVKLAAAARAISAGDLSKRVEITSRDEIGELATAFNMMAEQLAHSWADLEQQVHDLQQARQALQASEQSSRSIIDSIPLGFCMYEMGEENTLIFSGANPAAESILQLDLKQMTGQRIEQIFPWIANTEELEHYRQIAQQGQFWQVEHIAEGGKRAGSTYEVYPFQATPGKMVIAFQDITGRKQTEMQLHERAARLELVAQVGQQTTAILDLDDLLRRAVHLISDTFHYYNVIIRLVEDHRVMLKTATLPAFRPLEGTHAHSIGPGSITGWVAEHGQPLFVPDVSQDERYAFALEGLETRSELAVPIKSKGVVIGVLDVQSTELSAFSSADEFTLQIVADQLAIAIENARLYERVQNYAADLEQRVTERTAELAAVNKELEAFAYSVSHDLRAPLRSIDGFSLALMEDYHDKINAEGQDFLRRVRAASQRMSHLIDDLLVLSRLSRTEMHREEVDLSALVREITQDYQTQQPERQVEWVIADSAAVYGDARLLRVMLENLIGNAWKFTSKRPVTHIEFGYTKVEGQTTCFVRDNGAGFEMAYSNRLFGAFQRLHTEAEFEGSGIGLATVQRIIYRHGGRVWAEGLVDQGATFYFTL